MKLLRGEIRKFDQTTAARYALWENWYAPLEFLRSTLTGEIVTLGNLVPVITNPFVLDKLLENWRSAGIEIPDYDVVTLYDDQAFDDFISHADEQDFTIVADPLLDPRGGPQALGGIPIIPMRRLAARKSQD